MAEQPVLMDKEKPARGTVGKLPAGEPSDEGILAALKRAQDRALARAKATGSMRTRTDG